MQSHIERSPRRSPLNSLSVPRLRAKVGWRRRDERLNSHVRTESPQIQNFIDGQFVEPIGGKYLDNIEPATGKSYSQVADSDARDVDAAVAAAEEGVF